MLKKYTDTPHLYRDSKTRIYYYNQIIPVDCRSIAKRSVIRVSLMSNDFADIQNHYKSIFQFWQNEIRTIRINQKAGTDIVLKSIPKSPAKMRRESDNKRTISELINQYTDFKLSQNHWTNATYKEYRDTFGILIDYFTDIDVSDIDRGKAVKFATDIKKLPPNRKKKHPSKTIVQLLKMEHPKTISLKTYDKIISAISSMFKYAVEIEATKKNVFINLGIGKEKLKESQTNILPFTKEQLVTIFKDMPVEYLPICYISLYAGLRLGEVCGLTYKSLNVEDSYNVFALKHNHTRLKNATSKLSIPIHKKLYPIIFSLKHRVSHEIWDTDTPIFNFKVKDDRNYREVSRWFNAHLKRLGFGDEYNFHSFRHTFAEASKDLMLNNESNIKIHERLLRHKDQDIGTAIYGSQKIDMKVLANVVGKIKFSTKEDESVNGGKWA